MSLYSKNLIRYCIVSLLLLSSFFSCKNELVVAYDGDLFRMYDLAKNEERNFCLILVPDSNYIIDKHFVEKVSQNVKDKSDAVIYVADVSKEQNNWLAQWIPSSSYPITCVFSYEGVVLDCIWGDSYESIETIKQVVCNGMESSIVINYGDLNLSKKNFVGLIENTFHCYRMVNEQKIIKNKVDSGLSIKRYPFNLWLKLKDNDEFHYLDEKVIRKLSEELISSGNAKNIILYQDLFTYAQQKINPQYKIPIIELDVDTLKIHTNATNELVPFSVNIVNKGVFPVIVYDVLTGCNCVKYLSDKNLEIQPGRSARLQFVLSKLESDYNERNIFIASNSDTPLKEVYIVVSRQ